MLHVYASENPGPRCSQLLPAPSGLPYFPHPSLLFLGFLSSSSVSVRSHTISSLQLNCGNRQPPPGLGRSCDSEKPPSPGILSRFQAIHLHRKHPYEKWQNASTFAVQKCLSSKGLTQCVFSMSLFEPCFFAYNQTRDRPQRLPPVMLAHKAKLTETLNTRRQATGFLDTAQIAKKSSKASTHMQP